MENKVFNNITISTTSNKVNEKYKQEVNTKTAYISTDEKTAKAMQDFGLTQYTSKDEGENFFILKFADKLRTYFKDGTNHLRQDLSNIEIEGQETLNFKTDENRPVSINVVKGENMGNDFYRLQAILVDDMDQITQIEPENPFGTGDGVTVNDDDIPF